MGEPWVPHVLLALRRQRPQARILSGAWLDQAVLERHMHQNQRLFVLRTQPVDEASAGSRAAREPEAKAYWDGLTEQQDAWALRKMGFPTMGRIERTTAGTWPPSPG